MMRPQHASSKNLMPRLSESHMHADVEINVGITCSRQMELSLQHTLAGHYIVKHYLKDMWDTWYT